MSPDDIASVRPPPDLMTMKPFRVGSVEWPAGVVVEVRSQSDSWGEVFGKVGEYREAGVRAVVVIDMASRTASVYRLDRLQEIVAADDELTVPDVLTGFAVRVGKPFE